MTEPIPYQDISYYEAWKNDQAVETVWHKPGQEFLCVLAPHGGDIEAETDTAAVEMYKKMSEDTCSLWMFQGFDSTPIGNNAAKKNYHVTSTNIDSKKFPALEEIEDVGFQFCLSFHVKRNAEVFEVGGLADKRIREDVAEIVTTSANSKWGAVVDHEDGDYMGITEQNITNRLTHDSRSGVQIEMPGGAAKNYRKTIAENLANYFTELYDCLDSSGTPQDSTIREKD